MEDPFLDKKVAWKTAMEAKGHVPVLDEHDHLLDTFVLSEGFHNGPGCARCRWSCCWHCDEIESIPECVT